MIERPILFSAPMVRALLAGTKSQTRRIVKVFKRVPEYLGDVRDSDERLADDPNWSPPEHFANPDRWGWRYAEDGCHAPMSSWLDWCPYGVPGDRLWVRETWMQLYDAGDGNLTCLTPTGQDQQAALQRAKYKATDAPPPNFAARWRPSIFMPRWASRITLEVTDVRVERLQSISEADAIAEGIEQVDELHGAPLWRMYGSEPSNTVDPRRSYASLWESINGAGSWEANPWVWVVEWPIQQIAERTIRSASSGSGT